MSSNLPRKAIIAITSYNGIFYGEGTRTGLFFTEALHPFNALTKAGLKWTSHRRQAHSGSTNTLLTNSF